MSTVTFFSYLRSGLAAAVGTQAVDGVATEPSATANVTITVRGEGAIVDERELEPRAVRLSGPGEVLQLADSEVVQQYPEPGATDAEPNYFPHVELLTPDLPWRYSTAGPDDAGKSPPWLVLVAVEEGDGVVYEERPNKLATLEIDAAEDHLPDLTEAWAWVHVQLDDQADELEDALQSSPELVRVRLLCPMRLRAGRTWRACLVPATRAGVDAGLGRAVTPSAEAAWTAGPVTLPVYYSWQFTSSEGGDFKALVLRLTPYELPGTVGLRDLDISDPGSGLPSRRGTMLSFLGAMTSFSAQPRAWPDERYRNQYHAAVRGLINPDVTDPVADGGSYDPLEHDPVVAPPRYGAPQRFGHPVPESADAEEGFYATLNDEPQHRTVAALGFEVVRRDQEALMAAAWDYAAPLLAVNQRLNRASLLARAAVARRVKFATLPVSAQAEVTAPSYGLIADPAGGSVRSALDAAAIPHGVTISTFRRLGRQRGPLSPKYGAGAQSASPSSGVVTTSLLTGGAAELLEWNDGALPAGMDIAAVPATSSISDATATATRSRFARTHRVEATDRDLTPIGIPVDRDVILGNVPAAERSLVMSRPADGPLIATVTSSIEPPPAATWVAVALAVDPEAGVRRSVNSRMVGVDDLAPVPSRLRAAPVFPDPMYERLRALSTEYLVPGVGLVPDNTVGALEVNPEFVESFMIALNHELSREFRWREYPAQLWRTWFHQFWDTGAGGAPDLAADIHTWTAKSALGSNTAGGARLVLLIKGDLMRRYPDVNVYAIRASMVDDARAAPPGSEIRPPVFVGQLQRGVHFYGFDLTEEEARGDGAGEGWFFALEEQPRGPRFGFDAAPAERIDQADQAGATPASWSDMTWAHLANSANDPNPLRVELTVPTALQGLTLGTGSSADTWAEHAAAMARITLRTPTRVLIHGSALLPAPPIAGRPR